MTDTDQLTGLGAIASKKRLSIRFQIGLIPVNIIQAFDGDKFICMDSYVPENCLIYSFGIRSNVWSHYLSVFYEVLLVIFSINFTSFSKMWEFEDVMDLLKCKVVTIKQ